MRVRVEPWRHMMLALIAAEARCQVGELSQGMHDALLKCFVELLRVGVEEGIEQAYTAPTVENEVVGLPQRVDEEEPPTTPGWPPGTRPE